MKPIANSAQTSNLPDLAYAAAYSALSQNDGNSMPPPPLPHEQEHGTVSTQAHDSELALDTSIDFETLIKKKTRKRVCKTKNETEVKKMTSIFP